MNYAAVDDSCGIVDIAANTAALNAAACANANSDIYYYNCYC